MKNRIFVAIILGIFFFGNSNVFSEEVVWDFQNPGSYVYNKNNLTIGNGSVKTNLLFRQSLDYQDDGTLSWGAASADFDGDGLNDVYVANWGQNQLWINKGNNKFEEKNIPKDDGNSQAAIAADFDNDGDIDIYVANFNDQNKLWLNDGEANFTLFEISDDGGYSYGAYAKDLNNDGNIDIYVRNQGEKDVVWLGGFYDNGELSYTPYINPSSSKFLTKNIEDFSISGVSGDVKFQISFDGGEKWFYWNGNQWAETNKINGEETSSAEDINNNIFNFNADEKRFQWRAYLNSDGTSPAKLSEVKIVYNEPNYPPEIILENDEIEINEGARDILKVNATDKNSKQELNYFLGGVDWDNFEIDNEGNLRFKVAPDYENPQDSNRDNEYKILVGVRDSESPSEEDIKNLKIKIKDLEFKLTSYKGEKEVEFLTRENSTEPFVTITVDNPEGGDLEFLIEGGDDANLFNLNFLTGELSFKEGVDYENPSDKNKDNTYEVNLLAQVNGSKDQKAEQRFLIEIIDVHENRAPVILTSDEGESLNLGESNKVVTKIKAEDPDGDILSFSLVGGADVSLFEIDSETGQLSFKTAPDYENPKDRNKDNVYEIEVMVQDSGEPALSTSKKLKIYINNLGRVTLINSGHDSFDEVCKDSKASNFSPVGIHNQKVCRYEEDNYNYGPLKTDSYNCPADKILHQNMLIGDRDNKYSGWERSVIKEVKILQEHLNRLGYDVGSPDGIFGPATDKSVRLVQKAFGLEDDGMVGPQFRLKINSSCNLGNETNIQNEEELETEIFYDESKKTEDLQGAINRMMYLLQDLINKVRL